MVTVMSCGNRSDRTTGNKPNDNETVTPNSNGDIQTNIKPDDNEKEKATTVNNMLYKGNANFENIQQFEVSFLLSEDTGLGVSERFVHDLKLTITGMHITARYANMTINQNVGSITVAFNSSYTVQNNKVDISLGRNGHLALIFTDANDVMGTIAYIYVIEGQSGENSHPDIPVDFGSKSISFRAQ